VLDLREFHKIPGNALSIEEYPFDDPAAQERLSQQNLEWEKRKEEYMKQRIAERKSKGKS